MARPSPVLTVNALALRMIEGTGSGDRQSEALHDPRQPLVRQRQVTEGTGFDHQRARMAATSASVSSGVPTVMRSLS